MQQNSAKGRVLTIAGSDSGGGAGIQADIKTITMLGGYAASAITALTAQNTQGVFGIHDVPDDFIARQIELVLSDIGADAIKTGMLHSASVIKTVANSLKEYADIPLILDPVMVAKGGAALLKTNATQVLITHLIPRARLITPNIPEAELLTGIGIKTPDDMQRAGEKLLALGASAVLVKGGHLQGDEITDILIENIGLEGVRVTRYCGLRIDTRHTHGTGCTLASAIATGLAQGLTLGDATARGRDYVIAALKAAPGLGLGQGPLGHGFPMKKP